MPAIKGKITAEKAIVGFEGHLPIARGGRVTLLNSDVTIQRFKKDMISVGVYTHPIWEWTMDVTEERLYRWAAAFEAMQTNGVDVEVPVDHNFGAESNLGYVVEMFVAPNADGIPTLYGIHEIRGEDNIKVIEANKNVSVAIEKDFVDGKGNHYGEAIVHSSVVQQPVVPGQDEFEKIAASAKGPQQNVPVLTLSIEKKGKNMNEEMLAKLKEVLGAGDDLTEENALSRITERIETLNTAKSDVDKELLNIKAELEKLKAGGDKENKVASVIDPNLAEQMGVTAEQQLSLLVDGGNISPATQKALSEILIGKKTTRNLSMLSVGDGGKDSIFSQVIEALKLNKAIEMKERTGIQTFGRVIPDDENDDANAPDKESAEVMLSAAKEQIPGPPASK